MVDLGNQSDQILDAPRRRSCVSEADGGLYRLSLMKKPRNVEIHQLGVIHHRFFNELRVGENRLLRSEVGRSLNEALGVG